MKLQAADDSVTPAATRFLTFCRSDGSNHSICERTVQYGPRFFPFLPRSIDGTRCQFG